MITEPVKEDIKLYTYHMRVLVDDKAIEISGVKSVTITDTGVLVFEGRDTVLCGFNEWHWFGLEEDSNG